MVYNTAKHVKMIVFIYMVRPSRKNCKTKACLRIGAKFEETESVYNKLPHELIAESVMR